ncbi:hypothetical protein DL96DRAFT_1622186 [Flagelloscypha sp. PMI_526]|nr:hypothetical protein DL96DRAFT_1622186 [Flagelloscypha sp. PMI_526]
MTSVKQSRSSCITSKLFRLHPSKGKRTSCQESRSPNLPVEILHQILSYIPTSDKTTLFSLLRASRITSSVSERILYETLDLTCVQEVPSVSWKVFSQLDQLIDHLCCNARHASMVLHVKGCLYDRLSSVANIPLRIQVRKFGLVKRRKATHLWLERIPELPKHLTHLQSYTPPNRFTFSHYFMQCPTNDLVSLSFHSRGLFDIARDLFLAESGEGRGFGKKMLDSFIPFVTRQKNLKVLKTTPVIAPPPHATVPPTQKNSPLLPFDSGQRIEAIEGSCWFLTSVLPPTVYPRKLRFWDGSDRFTADEGFPGGLMDTLKYLKVLSLCFPYPEQVGGQEKLKDSRFLAAFGALPQLEVVEFKIPFPIDLKPLLSIISTFLGCRQPEVPSKNPGLKRLIVTYPTLFSPAVFRDWENTRYAVLEAVSNMAFLEIETLVTVEVGDFHEPYLRRARGSESKCESEKVKKDEDWWIDA